MTEENRRLLSGIPSLTGTPPDLDVSALPADPVETFIAWLTAAVDGAVLEPRSATLSTVDSAGIPDARVLVLRDVGDRGWAFGSTASSRKGAQLAANSGAAMSFWWPEQMRAVRLLGEAVEASAQESAADLARRHPVAQARIADGDWRVWWLRPSRVEFWQGAADRDHLRIVYTRGDSGWSYDVTNDGSS